MINVAEPEELDRLDPAICDGIGLVRTEFLFHKAASPTRRRQYRAYRRIVEWAAPKPVVLRTLDAGGDKPIPGLTIDGESNPFLGTRGIRLCLARPDVFRVQLRALARAAVHGNAKIMLPMVTVPEELDQAAALLDEAVAELEAEGIACARPPLGIMVEVPAVAVCRTCSRGRLLLHRQQRPHAIRHRGGARYRRRVPALSTVIIRPSSRLIARVVDAGRTARNRGQPLRRHGRRPGTYPRPDLRRLAFGFGRAPAGRSRQDRHLPSTLSA